MIMKIVTYALIVLLVVMLGGAAVFYLKMYQPMVAEYDVMKSGMSELDKAKAELKKCRDKETRETGWLNPEIDALSAVLADEIKAGKVEVLSAGSRVFVNIAEDALYLHASYTFTRDSQQLLSKLESLLRGNELKGKKIEIGNTTDSVPAQGKGRKKTPPKDGRTLAADRSAALVKYLEKKGLDPNALVLAAYSPKQPEIGFKLKAHKTVLVLENLPAGPAIATKQEAQSKPTQTSKPTATAPAAPAAKPQAIPIQPAQPKAN
jgi:outer membrane protein OmpA-like peptidoglycan-associated protein